MPEAEGKKCGTTSHFHTRSLKWPKEISSSCVCSIPFTKNIFLEQWPSLRPNRNWIKLKMGGERENSTSFGEETRFYYCSWENFWKKCVWIWLLGVKIFFPRAGILDFHHVKERAVHISGQQKEDFFPPLSCVCVCVFQAFSCLSGHGWDQF